MECPADSGGRNIRNLDGVIGAHELVGVLISRRGRRHIAECRRRFISGNEVLGWINPNCERTNRGCNELQGRETSYRIL